MENLRRLIAFSLRPDACCVDVGAHRGAVLHEILRVAPHGRHVAYEPLPELAAGLRAAFPSVEIREAALSDRSGQSSFQHVRGEAEGCSGFVVCTTPPGYVPDVEQIDVRLERLDDVLDPASPVAFVKVDVEGAEKQVFAGALHTLERTRPTIMFEHAYAASSAYGTDPSEVYSLLTEEVGLRIFGLNGDGPFEASEFEQMSHQANPINFVAHR